MKRLTRAFLVNMSRGEPIPVEEEEIPKLLESLKRGAVCAVKRGIINPSYFVSIGEDKERLREWREESNYNPVALKAGIPPLTSLFGNVPSLGQLVERIDLLPSAPKGGI